MDICCGVWNCVQGLALTKVPKIKFLIIISGAKLKNEALAEKAFSSAISIPSLHFLGKPLVLFDFILSSKYNCYSLADR